MRYHQSMNKGCKNQISKWLQNQQVKNFCKKSCGNCIRKFLNQWILPLLIPLHLVFYKPLSIKYLATPIHCEWSNWQVGDCSAPCGGGTRTKSRTKIINNESSGGKCVGQSQTRESCNAQSCAGKLFTWHYINKFIVIST